LLDYLLAEAGAKEFRLVHSARRNPRHIAARNGQLDAVSGDMLITTMVSAPPVCQKRTVYKNYIICILP
jgi:hypothetical protein